MSQKLFLQCKTNVKWPSIEHRRLGNTGSVQWAPYPFKIHGWFLCQKPHCTSQTIKSNQNLARVSFLCMYMGDFTRRFSCPVLQHWESPGYKTLPSKCCGSSWKVNFSLKIRLISQAITWHKFPNFPGKGLESESDYSTK